uniref:DNA topoisomerase (ATP-hydrolyzing) n=1 Tax=Picea sitchensis TaxID=3332 RepID=D5AE71_PICSI|nr:unknown [Picea sitchensis]
MAIGTLTLEKVQQLCAERDKLEDDVEELKKETPKSLWCKDLDAFTKELDAQDLQEAKDDEYELSNMGNDAARIFRQVGKNQRKNTKKTVTAEKADSQSTTNNQASTASVTTTNAQKEIAKPKRGGGKKGAAKKKMEVESDEDDELDTSLQDRLAAYNHGLSADQSAVEDQGSKQNSPTEDFQPKQKETTKRAKKAAPVYVEMSDEDDTMGTIPEEENEEEGEKQPRKAGAKGMKAADGRTKKATIVSDSDSDFGFEEDDDTDEEAIPRKGSKKPAADKPPKPSKTKPKKSNSTTTAPVPRKRGPKRPTQGQKLIDEMLKPTSVDDAVDTVQPSPYKKSPEKKVRKMRPSPFNKKSGSVMSKLRQESDTSPPSANGSAGSSSNSPEEVNEVPKPAGRSRPQRATRAPVQYVLSESSDEKDEDEDEISDSDFVEDDD